jgi:DNA-binding protein Fis
MKTIQVIVTPTAPANSFEENSRASTEGHAGVASDEPGSADRSMRIQVVVTETIAQKILASVFNLASQVPRDLSLEEVLDKEPAAAGPNATDLVEKILKRAERQLLSQVYAESGFVKQRTAERLGINRNTLYKKLREYHLDRPCPESELGSEAEPVDDSALPPANEVVSQLSIGSEAFP